MGDLISREAVLEFEEYVGERATWDKPYPKGDLYVKSEIIERIPSAEPEGKVMLDKEAILQAGKENREVEFRIGGRLFRVREVAQ